MEMETPDFGAMLSTLMDGKAAELQAFLTPVLLLVCWTLVTWLWMYVTRIPAMQKAGVDPDSARHPGTYGDKLPANVRAVADNYNHLHEQPTVFYALMLTLALLESQSATALTLAWIYVALRILHSLSQILGNRVVVRFGIFALSGLVLVALAAHAAVAAFSA